MENKDPKISARQLSQILYSFRLVASDPVGPLIEDLIEYFKQNDPNFKEDEFLKDSDYRR